MQSEDEKNLRVKLTAEIDTAPWSALVRHFAFGRVYLVRAPWTLLDAAVALHQDASKIVKDAMHQGLLQKPSDSEAQQWQTTDPSFPMLVISPFVLIQAPLQ